MEVLRVTSDGTFDYLDVRMPAGMKVQFRRLKGRATVTRYAGRDPLTRTSIWKYASADHREKVGAILDREMADVPRSFGLYPVSLY